MKQSRTGGRSARRTLLCNDDRAGSRQQAPPGRSPAGAGRVAFVLAAPSRDLLRRHGAYAHFLARTRYTPAAGTRWPDWARSDRAARRDVPLRSDSYHRYDAYVATG